MSDINLQKLDIDSIQAGFKSAKFSSAELTQAYLDNIKADDTNSFISISLIIIPYCKSFV